MDNDTFKHYKSQKVIIAKQLYYGKKVVNEIKKAKTLPEVERIMITARHNL